MNRLKQKTIDCASEMFRLLIIYVIIIKVNHQVKAMKILAKVRPLNMSIAKTVLIFQTFSFTTITSLT